MSHMCKRIFKFELQLSSYWQNINLLWYCTKFHIFTKIVIFQVYLQLFRSTASSLSILWQGHVRNTLFHFCQLWAVNQPSDNSCNFMFDCSLDDIDVSFKNGFSILRLNPRSFNWNRDNIQVFLSNIKYNFSIIVMSETWFKQDNSNLIDIPNYFLINT